MSFTKILSNEQISEFTSNGEIKFVYYNLIDESNNSFNFNMNDINKYIDDASNRKLGYYGSTDSSLYSALDKYDITNKDVLNIGSCTCWYESILLSFGASNIYTLDYNKIEFKHPKIKFITYNDYDNINMKFDFILSISTIEHSGMGRYGDEIDPFGDIKSINKIKSMLSDDGLLFLSVPIGTDCVYWNMQRVYGKLRFPLLINGFDILDKFSDIENIHDELYNQPVYVLKKSLGLG